MTKSQQRVTLATFMLLPVAIFFLLKSGKPVILKLPVLGDKYYDEKLNDTVYHTVSDFSFTDQLGRPVNNHTFDSGLYLANFFFTTCKTICPTMNGSVLNLYEKYKGRPMVKFLSHTVDPETDSVPVMKRYADNLHADPNKWYFVTGQKKDVYKIAGMNGYMLPTGEEEGIVPDSLKFFHSQQVLLVDDRRRVRGVYDVLSPSDLKRLDDEIKVLCYELTDKYNKTDAEKR
ncbi:MAG: SCO family protein [Flavobacteriaceae bacterium]|nr:SCO family protein [Flavobacteriaceae bacterium]